MNEAEQVVASHPGLTLRLVDADDPVITADFVPGRIDVYVRAGVLVGAETILRYDND